MNIRSILARKGHEVVTSSPDETVLEATRTLVGRDIGAVVVVDGDRILGILSERDVLRLTARSPEALATVSVGEVMTSDPVTARPGDGINHVMNLMTNHRIRHLPVVDDGRLRGIVSIGDVVNALRTEVESENRHLRDYIQGVTA